MRIAFNALAIVLAMAFALCLDISPDKPSFRVDLTSEAEAIVGRPLTPLSCAGVARRTTRRVIVGTSVAASASAAAAASASQTAAPPPSAPPSSAPPPPAATSHSAVPVGTVVAALPSDCSTVAVDGVSYSDCGGVFYKAAFQGNNLVYVVVEKPMK